MSWPRVELRQVATIVGGSTPSRGREEYWNGSVCWLTPTDLPMPGESIADVTDTSTKITDKGLAAISAPLLPVGTVLFSSRATIGKLGISKVPLATNQGFANFIPTDQVDSKYLAYCLLSSTNEIASLAGSTTFKEVTKTSLKRFRIPLPPLSEQRRIVEILDQADALRKKRAEADAKASRILQALFYKMFGDPVTNPMGWPKTPLGNLTNRITKGESPKWQGFSYCDAGPLFVTSENVRNGSLDLSLRKHIPQEFHAKLSRSSLRPGDVLVNLVGASIGRCCIVPDSVGEANINQAVAVVTPGKDLRSAFLCSFLLSPPSQALIHGGKVEAARANISLNDLRTFKVPNVPVELQERFERAASDLSGVNHLRMCATGQIDTLFGSLLHRAFTGDLTAKWREAHMKELLAELEEQAKALGIDETQVQSERWGTRP